MRLIITADLGRMRAFRVKPSDDPTRDNYVVQEIETPPLEHTPQSISELTSDQAGRFKSDGSQGMSHGEAHGLEREEERRLIAQLAKNIGSVVDSEKPVGWFLAAPQTINARLLDGIPAALQKTLRENRTQDLAKLSANDLGKRFGVIE